MKINSAGFPHDSMRPHNLVLSVIGASLLWVGSFGFNADVGNGASTLVPSLLLLLYGANPRALHADVDVRLFALFSAIFLWQALYGTLVYFFQ